MSVKDKGGWLSSFASAARKVAKAIGSGIKKVAKLFAKVVTGSIHYPVLAIEFCARWAIKAIKVALFAIAAVVVAIVIAAVFVAFLVLLTVYKVVNGIGFVLRAPYDLTRPGGAEGVKTNLVYWARSWRLSYFTCMTPGDVVRREGLLREQNEYATAWRLIAEANDEVVKVAAERASRPAQSKKGRTQPSRGQMPQLGLA